MWVWLWLTQEHFQLCQQISKGCFRHCTYFLLTLVHLFIQLYEWKTIQQLNFNMNEANLTILHENLMSYCTVAIFAYIHSCVSVLQLTSQTLKQYTIELNVCYVNKKKIHPTQKYEVLISVISEIYALGLGMYKDWTYNFVGVEHWSEYIHFIWYDHIIEY